MYDELVKSLREIHPEEFGDAWDFAFACQQAMHEAADAIDSMSEAYDKLSRHMDDLAALMPRWIPVTERLPEEYETVLLIARTGEVIVGFYDIEHNSYCDMSGFRHLCTHWMHLPEPPKEET